MRLGTSVVLFILAVLPSCGGRPITIGSSVGQKLPDSAASPDGDERKDPLGATPEVEAAAVTERGEPQRPPAPDPMLVKALVEKTGESSSGLDNALHLRLEVAPRPAGQRWVVAVVNRGTERARVLFDLRRLTLTLQPPDESDAPRPKWKKPPPPRLCRLPDAFAAGTDGDSTQLLEPGEGLVATFDPRLYCISAAGDSLLATGQRVTVKLGFLPKPPRVLYKRGVRQELPALQSAPFVAESAEAIDAGADPERERRVKQLVASDFTLTAELTASEAEEDPTLPLSLRLVRGADAATESNATAVVEVRARRKTQIYFRRELLSFTVHGPDGVRACDPEPDDRTPDRQAYTLLAAGQSLSATSLLGELCPKFTFGRAGLYLISARLDAQRDGAEFGFSAFTGRLESRREALVRIRVGDLPVLPPPEPLRVKVGQ